MATTIHTDTEFKATFDRFLGEAVALCETHRAEHFPMLGFDTFKVEDGRRYVRVWKGSSCYFFVDKTNGDVLKPASWKAPAKHARGNIFTNHATECMGPYGVNYLR